MGPCELIDSKHTNELNNVAVACEESVATNDECPVCEGPVILFPSDIIWCKKCGSIIFKNKTIVPDVIEDCDDIQEPQAAKDKKHKKNNYEEEIDRLKREIIELVSSNREYREKCYSIRKNIKKNEQKT